MQISTIKGSFIAMIFMIIVWSGCERPVITVNKGELTFSADTVKFDTIFTTLPSPTEWLIATNPTANNIKVARIWLESGSASEFELIVDGVKTIDAKDVIIPAKDSIHLFLKMKSQAKDRFVEEYVSFTIGNNTQRVLIRAFVLDAYFYPTNVSITQQGDEFAVSYDTAYCNLVLKNDKPHVISGPMYIPKGCTLTIEPGAQLYFTPYKIKNPYNGVFFLYSMLQVAGTLKVNGMAGNPVTMQNTRLQTGPFYNYTEQADQWRGIKLENSSSNNTIAHLLLKNARIGIEVDSASVNSNPKLTMTHTRIRNMGAYGIYAVNYIESGGVGSVPTLVVENSLISNCSSNTLYIDRGGWNEFYNCTFDNSGSVRTRDPQVAVANFLKIGDDIYGPYDIRTRFVNCAIWGGNKHELLIATRTGRAKEITFENCLVQIDQTEYNYDEYFQNVIKNTNPLFNSPINYDYRPKLNSPLINAGADVSARFTDDIRGRSDSLRTLPFDIGAYEYYEIK